MRGLGHAETAGHRSGSVDVAELRRVRLDAYQRGIMQAMIAAFKLDDLVPSCRGAGQADGVHGGFGAAVAEATISTGNRLQISSASSHSMSCGMPNMVPVVSRFSTAFITAGWQCPAMSAPKRRL